MKPNFTPNPQNISPHYTGPPLKHNSPNIQPRLSHNAAYTNSSKDISIKKEEFKEHKFLSTYSPNYASTNKKFNQCSPNKPEISSKPPSPQIQNKNAPLKGSMYVGDSKFQPPTKYVNHNVNNNGIEKPKRPPRMSQANFSEMRASNIEFHNQGSKIPSFLHEKRKNEEGSNGKKIPYPNQMVERPESSKQVINKFDLQTEASLSSSYGLMKQSKSEIDPTSEWVKKSWNKKKQKKLNINDFDQIKQLGSGKYGQVYLVRQKKSKFVCALKIIEKKLLKDQEITEQFIRELKIQTFINHPNIIKMFGFFDDAVNIYIILEVGTGGQLFKQLKKHQCMPEYKVAGIMRQICKAIDQLHSNRIIHRDIKPQNIVLHDNVIKLCDFGWSVHRDESLRKTFCGTPLYVCPQILKGNEYDEKIDIWSLGVMMYEMIVGQNPFKITKEEELVKIVKDKITIPSYVEISTEGKNFLDSCLQKNPEQRLNIRQLLNHDFFKKYPEKSTQKMI